MKKLLSALIIVSVLMLTMCEKEPECKTCIMFIAFTFPDSVITNQVSNEYCNGEWKEYDGYIFDTTIVGDIPPYVGVIVGLRSEINCE